MYGHEKNHLVVKIFFEMFLFLFLCLPLQMAFFASIWAMVSVSIGVALALGFEPLAGGAVTQGGGVAVATARCTSTCGSPSPCSSWKTTWIRSAGGGAWFLAVRLKHQAMQKMSMTRLQIAAP